MVDANFVTTVVGFNIYRLGPDSICIPKFGMHVDPKCIHYRTLAGTGTLHHVFDSYSRSVLDTPSVLLVHIAI